MQHDTRSPAAYLASLPADWRGALVHRLDSLLQERGLQPTIGYNMLRYEDGGGAVLHMNAQARHVGLYPGRLDIVDPGGVLLAGFDCGAGCVRLKRRDAEALDPITALIDRVLQLRADGIVTDC